ncbi:antitoxin VbhA family protein [Ralstonia insidiosa]|uniref:Antitoxin VbhA family protein n=1 Tax=Ralstonia insidiosa TaxID=190721 RepID=A0A848NXF2_9RALS|nr:antitoxin VbhA family protein [Ralstonia insidiosa]
MWDWLDAEPKVSEEERLRREKVISFARGSCRFEGIILPPEIEVINERFINGDITGEEHSRLCLESIDSM